MFFDQASSLNTVFDVCTCMKSRSQDRNDCFGSVNIFKYLLFTWVIVMV